MNKKELYKQIERLHHDLKKFESIKNDKNLLGDDIKALEAVMDLIMLGAGAFTTDELVKELEKREGALTLKKEGSPNFPKIDNIFLKFNALQCWYEKVKDKENQSFDGLCNLLKDIKEDYKKINNFYNNGAVG